MKKIILSILLLLLIPFFTKVNAQDTWTINNFDSNIHIQKDGVVEVNETIDVDFGNIEKHGIYRTIPFTYSSADKQTYTRVNVLKVLQDNKTAGKKITTENGNIIVRIGDADKTINGKHRYQIKYSVEGVIRPFTNYDEFYWNVTGNDWEAIISSATATVTTDEDIMISSTCYEGYAGSTTTCSNTTEQNSATFQTKNPIQPYGGGLTIVTAFKKGLIPIITVEKPKTFLEEFISWPSLFTFIVALSSGIAAIFYFWLKNGRDYYFPGITGFLSKEKSDKIKPLGAHEPIIVEYTPPEKLPPAMLGVLVDERADTLDITSTIIDLAARGYLTITEIPKKWIFGNIDYSLSQTQKSQNSLYSYEKELLKRIFSSKTIKISELKKTFYDDLAKVKEKLYQDVVDKKYFPENPEKIRGRYLLIGFIILFVSFFGIPLSITNKIIILADFSFAGILVGIVVIFFSRFMPRRSALGRETYRRIRGYRLFIEKAESYKQKFFENKNMFNEVLPYAIVFGLTTKFAKAMKDMGVKPQNPTWYRGAQTFNVINFSNEISNFSGSFSTSIASTPSSSGFSGGSSGGGFGGGGGGSW